LLFDPEDGGSAFLQKLINLYQTARGTSQKKLLFIVAAVRTPNLKL
jgi:hypothetical protein